ncbi:MAG: hypothetical protein ACU0B1_02680 [Thermohalobaculum sp.]
MKKEEAKIEVLNVWRQWSDEKKKGAGVPLLFYSWLQKNHPNLLSFRASGDKYQIVAGWIKNDPLNQLHR